MSEDFGAAVVDSASAVESTPVTNDSTSSTSTSTTTTDSNTDLSVITADNETPAEETAETETHKADGTERTPEEREQFKTEAAAKGTGKEVLPTEQRNALKALRELDPKYAGVVKSIHGAVERWNAALPMLGKGTEGGVNGLKAFLADAGVATLPEARQALANQSKMIDAVSATDELLYAGDKTLWSNVYEDLVAQGKEDVYGKTIENGLEHLRSVDEAAYYGVVKGTTVDALQSSGFTEAVNSAWQCLAKGDVEGAKSVLKQVGSWFTSLREEVGSEAKLNKALSEREEKLQTKEAESQKAERGKVETGVAESCEKSSNQILGKSLGGFLRQPYFREFPYDTKVVIGNQIKEALYAELKADKTYQSQMSVMWKQKSIDKAKMVGIHEAKLQDIGDRIVRSTITKMYPNWAKGGSAAGRVASAVASKANTTKAAAQSISTMKPIYVAARPESLVRDSVKVGGKTYDTNQLQILQIQGKGFVKSSTGQLRFVTWRKN